MNGQCTALNNILALLGRYDLMMATTMPHGYLYSERASFNNLYIKIECENAKLQFLSVLHPNTGQLTITAMNNQGDYIVTMSTHNTSTRKCGSQGVVPI